MIEDRVRFLKRVPLFEGLGDDHLRALASVTTRRQFPKGMAIFFEGDPGDALYIVREGYVKIYRVAEDGREKTLALLGDGEFFGEMALFDDEPRSAIAEAMESTVAYSLRQSDVAALMADNPALTLAVIRVLNKRLRRTNAELMDVIFRDVRVRMGQLLLELADRHGAASDAGARIELKLTHQELANLVGTARETVSRVLGAFQDARYITFDGRHIVIVDREGLQKLA